MSARRVRLTRATSAFACLVALAAPACGGDVDASKEPGSGGAGASGPGSTGTGAQATSGNGAGGAGACAAFADEDGSGVVTVRVINNAPQDVFLRASCLDAHVDMISDDDEFWSDTVFCAATCEDLQVGSPPDCAPCGSFAIRVPPGGVHEVHWNGTDYTTAPMPTDCYANAGDDFGNCGRFVSAPAQRYQALIGGYSQCDGGESGPCVCDADNRCQGQAGGQVINTIPAFFDYPSTLSVDLVFDSCAFGCPGGENDGTAPAP